MREVPEPVFICQMSRLSGFLGLPCRLHSSCGRQRRGTIVTLSDAVLGNGKTGQGDTIGIVSLTHL